MHLQIEICSVACNIFRYLTIIRRFGYEMVVANKARSAELAIIISYPTSECGIIVLLKTPTKYREFFPTSFVKTTDFQLVFIFSRRVQLPYLESMVLWLIYYDG